MGYNKLTYVTNFSNNYSSIKIFTTDFTTTLEIPNFF